MAGLELFSHADRFRYRGHIISSTTASLIVCLTFTYLSPFLLAYYTGAFTITETVYSEQPRIGSTIKYLLMIDTDDSTTARHFMSSYAALNRDFLSSFIFGTTTDTQTDTDGDGLNDEFVVSCETHLPANININSINIWIVLQFELRRRQRIQMETLALFNFVPSRTFTTALAKNITLYGNLRFQQRQSILNFGTDLSYENSIINVDNITSNGLESILDQYFQRKFYTTLEQQEVLITPQSPPVANRVQVNAVVNVGRLPIRVVPGIWEEFKWGWIQYIYTLLPFLFLFQRIKVFLFSNQLVRVLGTIENHSHYE